MAGDVFTNDMLMEHSRTNHSVTLNPVLVRMMLQPVNKKVVSDLYRTFDLLNLEQANRCLVSLGEFFEVDNMGKNGGQRTAGDGGGLKPVFDQEFRDMVMRSLPIKIQNVSKQRILTLLSRVAYKTLGRKLEDSHIDEMIATEYNDPTKSLVLVNTGTNSLSL